MVSAIAATQHTSFDVDGGRAASVHDVRGAPPTFHEGRVWISESASIFGISAHNLH
jgi:hypothetical protein